MAASPPDDWNTDFLDLVDALLAARVDFLVVGAFALAQHGLLRATADDTTYPSK